MEAASFFAKKDIANSRFMLQKYNNKALRTPHKLYYLPYFCLVKQHEIYMQRCIQLAKNGMGTTYPNPLVGSVIVHNGRIIGEGWHKKAGEAHAEVNAVNSVADKSLLKESTMYVSLEPCSHFGKTPPCCDLIIAQGIPHVIVGTTDPNEKVGGQGIQKLLAAGKNVTVGVLEEDCDTLNKRFFTFHNKKRPYIILKWAETRDGFISPETREAQKPVWITNAYSRQLVHKWRSEEHAILVGAQTVIDDNPSLTVRDWSGNNPVRIVIDKDNRISKESHIFDNEAQTISLSETDPVLIAQALYHLDIQSVIVEGGGRTLQAFIDADLWDEARVFTGNVRFGKGTKAPGLECDFVCSESIYGDDLLIYRNI
jgi:diaminohydroxyphosphoribosylaminopyrimidine deaminase/5-amino-6-(5-phosphoribosylamino)uracil reductase